MNYKNNDDLEAYEANTQINRILNDDDAENLNSHPGSDEASNANLKIEQELRGEDESGKNRIPIVPPYYNNTPAIQINPKD